MPALNFVLSFITSTAFIWLPIVLGIVFWRSYTGYKREIYINEKLDYDMLEINIPKDVFKSPKAMELVIEVLHHLGGGAMSWKNRFWDGAVLYPSSLEIVSIEGSIYFFIRCSKKLTALVKSTLYSQFPNAEINEVDDYTKYVPDYTQNEDSWSLYGADFKLARDNFIPIKTYVDYELDSAVGKLDENQKIDPITPMLEFLGTLRAGEQIWIQFVIRADPFNSWREDANKKIQDIMGRGKPISDDEPFQTVKLTYAEQEMVKSIERNLSKPGFECVIRGLYLAKKENENPGVKGFFKGPIFRPYGSQYLNGIKKNTDTTYDWVWEDITGMRYPALKRSFFNDYINRAGFYNNSFFKKNTPPVLFTSEELATLFHIPGRVSETVSLERIDATKSEAPGNLPT